MTQGLYQHTKSGKRYELIGVAMHTETGEKMVLYRALYRSNDLADEYGDYPLFVRPYDMFFETVMVNGAPQSRFQKVDQSGELPLFITGNQHKADFYHSYSTSPCSTKNCRSMKSNQPVWRKLSSTRFARRTKR